jgi:conjugative transfer signal peptidase TraF
VETERRLRKGDRVFVCPPLLGALQEGFRRGYLRRGLCAGGVAPLIKTVAATSGQRVSIAGCVRIDGAILPHSRLMEFDGEGRPLSPHVGGQVPPGAVYLHSSSPGSFDSRYFGPVATTNILGLARGVWTRDP